MHRGAHQLARLSTDAYENARDKVKRFIGASDRRCVYNLLHFIILNSVFYAYVYHISLRINTRIQSLFWILSICIVFFREIVFTRGATESINLVSNSWGDTYVGKGDEIVLTVMEHHSNLVPWQSLAQRRYMVPPRLSHHHDHHMRIVYYYYDSNSPSVMCLANVILE